jgi:hypothetical protein
MKLFKGINIRKFIVQSVVAAAIGAPVFALISWLARDNGAMFFERREITLMTSIAQLVSFFLIILCASFLINYLIVRFRKLIITDAKYGVKNKYTDITHELNNFISNNKLNIRLSNGITGGFDPAPNVYKHATIDYMIGRRKLKLTVSEGDRIILPAPRK